jgi:predicted transcriptional regulator of viral defense system
MKPSTFLDGHPVFRLAEFRAAHVEEADRSPATTASLLRHHVASGRLISVRRGLYAVVPPHGDAASFRVDPFLVAGHASDDAVIGYHAALQLLGKAHSISSRLTYLTRQRAKPFWFQDIEYVPVLVPPPFRARADLGGAIREERRLGLMVRVTSHERTMVDVLDAPQYGGGWEEIWRSLESIEFLDLDVVVAYALALGSALTIARVGYFLEQHRDRLLVDDAHLHALRTHAPTNKTYFDRRHRSGGRYVATWNLIVPDLVRERAWAEVP